MTSLQLPVVPGVSNVTTAPPCASPPQISLFTVMSEAAFIEQAAPAPTVTSDEAVSFTGFGSVVVLLPVIVKVISEST